MTSGKHLLALSALLLLAACGGKEEAPAPEAATEPAPMAAPEAAAPAAEMAEAPAAAGAGVDASTLYAGRCASCHGPLAEGANGNPSLAKLSRADIEAKLQGYRDGKTMGPKTAIMAPMAKSLSDEEIAALASYLGS